MELQCCIFGWALSLGVFCLLISSGAVQAKISDQNSRLRIAELEAELQSTKVSTVLEQWASTCTGK